MTQYTFTVNFKSNIKNATLSTPCPRNVDGSYQVYDGDTIRLIFNDPDKVIQNGKMIVNKLRVPKPEAVSPFSGSTGPDISVVNNAVLTVDVLKGRWGFSITFDAPDINGKIFHHVLPDPELQVGSIGGDSDGG